MGAIAAVAIVVVATISLFTPLPLQTISVGFLVVGFLFLVLCAAASFEAYAHRSTRRKVQYVQDRAGRFHYLPGASRQAAEHKTENPYREHAKGDFQVMVITFTFAICFMIASLIIGLMPIF